MDTAFSMVEHIKIAYFLKNMLQVVDNIEPWNSGLENWYDLNMKGGDCICVTATEFKLIVKFLKYISYKLKIVDNKLKIERYDTKAIRENKKRRKENGTTGSACDDSTIQ